MRIEWTRRYLRELAAIRDSIADHDPGAASRIVRTIHTRTGQLLSAHPHLGRKGVIASTRELVISGTSYIVAYRVREDRVEVLFVQHAAREWPDEA